MADSDRLAAAIGRVAMADAAVDEWVVLALSAALAPMEIDDARMLVGSDNLDSKIKKLRSLLERRDYACSETGPQHAEIADIAKRTNQLKRSRDKTIHAVYTDPLGQTLSRFRSRTTRTEETSIVELISYAEQLQSLAEEWSAVVGQLEHQWAARQWPASEAHAILEDCRELLAVRRLTDEAKRCALRDSDEMRIALRGHGRWRLLASDESVDEAGHEAVLSLDTGRIIVVAPDGSRIEGGDTGWRDVTALAVEEDPAVEQAMLRRVHNRVSYHQVGGSLQVEQVRDSLAARLFGDSPQADLPSYLADLEGLSPQQA